MRLINVVQAGPLDEAPRLHVLVEDVLVFVVSLVGAIAVLVIIGAGIMYMTSGGDQTRVDTAKKALTAGIVGLVIAVLSFVVVTTVSSLI